MQLRVLGKVTTGRKQIVENVYRNNKKRDQSFWLRCTYSLFWLFKILIFVCVVFCFLFLFLFFFLVINFCDYYYINVREYRRGNQKWTIQRNWQHMTHITKENRRQYVLDTTTCYSFTHTHEGKHNERSSVFIINRNHSTPGISTFQRSHTIAFSLIGSFPAEKWSLTP